MTRRRTSRSKERETFLSALDIWDRPEGELFGRPLGSDVDTDSIVERWFSTPSGGILAE